MVFKHKRLYLVDALPTSGGFCLDKVLIRAHYWEADSRASAGRFAERRFQTQPTLSRKGEASCSQMHMNTMGIT